ncbi:MAG: hypothetical protein QGG53_35385 [Planctomycetota bacterium]|jgi:hypothetical protein|nr:hypothetical protein [Planctomycetota bacterium]
MFCTACGQALNVSATEVRQHVQDELNIERWKKLEVSLRNVLAFVIVFAVGTKFLSGKAHHLPALDMMPSVPLPNPPTTDPPIVNFKEEGAGLPDLVPPQYVRPDASAARKVVNELLEKVYSMNNVVLHLKTPKGRKRQGRLIKGQENDKYYYFMDAFTKREDKVEKENVLKVEAKN